MILVNNFDTPGRRMAEEIGRRNFSEEISRSERKAFIFSQINRIICNIYEICICKVNIAALVLKLEKT